MFQVTFDRLSEGPFPLKGSWNSSFFKNNNPIVLELGCGKGDYTIGLARVYPEKNFIGVDIKGARMWYGCKISQTENLKNVAFLRSKIQLIENFFGQEEVDEIWITFPDPQPRSSREKKRLTSPEFLKRYRNIMKPNGIVNLKTDDEQLYQYTVDIINEQRLKVISNIPDIHNNGYAGDQTMITTFYEKMWLKKGLTIKYLRYSINPHNG